MLSLYVLLAATFASLIIGCFWYSPKIFGTIWAESQGIEPKSLKPTWLHFLAEFILSFLIALGLAFFIEWTDSKTSVEGALIGLFASIGFVVPNILAANIWSHLPFLTSLVMCSYNIIRYIVMGALIGMLS